MIYLPNVLFFILMTYLPFNLLAEDIFSLGDLYFETVDDNKAIPYGIVTTLLEDKQGILWIGTQEGLLKYDGYNFRHFRVLEEELNTKRDFHVQSLWQTPDGKLWIGTFANGLMLYNPKTEKLTHFLHQKDTPNSLAHNSVTALVGDNQGGIWIGTHEGLQYLNISTNNFTHYRHDINDPTSINHNYIRALLIDDKNRLWVGSLSGLNRLSQGESKFERIYSDPNNTDSLAGKKIFQLYQASNGNVWIATYKNGIAWITPDDETRRVTGNITGQLDLNTISIYSIIQPIENEIWLGSLDTGILVLNASTGKLLNHIKHDSAIHSSINLDSIGALMVDKSGLVWVGPVGRGLQGRRKRRGA